MLRSRRKKLSQVERLRMEEGGFHGGSALRRVQSDNHLETQPSDIFPFEEYDDIQEEEEETVDEPKRLRNGKIVGEAENAGQEESDSQSEMDVVDGELSVIDDSGESAEDEDQDQEDENENDDEEVDESGKMFRENIYRFI